MKPILIISAGPGREDLLTIEAYRAIEACDLLYGASRHTSLTTPEKARPLFPFASAFADMERMRAEGLTIGVLVSGDAGLYSLLPRLTEHFGADSVKVLPGVGALQAFSSGLALPWQDAAVISAHGRDLSPSALCHTARTHQRTFMFLDKEHNAAWIKDSLHRGGLAHVRVTIGDRLSYPDEYIGPADGHDASALCMAMLENPRPESGLPPIGLPDDAFIRGKTPMTKREIRMQVLTEMQLTPDAVVWDVGAGTGSVTVECACQCPLGQVYAIEQKADAVQLIRDNIAAHHALNVSVIEGRAPEALTSLPCPTHVFLGGTGHETGAILDLLERFGQPIRIVATAVTMETVQELHARFSRYPGWTASQVAVSRLSPLGSYTMLQAQNPVFIFAAALEGKA